MNLRIRQKHSSTHWEIEFQKAETTKVLHFHHGLGLIGQCSMEGILDKIEVQSWYKVQERFATVKADPGCVWISFQMSHLEESVAGEIIDELCRSRKLPLTFFLDRNVPALPTYQEVSNYYQQLPKPTWKSSEILRLTAQRRELLEGLYRSFVRLLEPAEMREPELTFMRDASSEQLITRAQYFTTNHALYQVRLENVRWVPVMLTVDQDEAKAKQSDFEELGSSTQIVTLNPSQREQRVWQVIAREGTRHHLKCQRTHAYGIFDTDKLSMNDALYLATNSEFKAEVEMAEKGMMWPNEHNFLIDLVCEEKAFIWGDLWQVQAIATPAPPLMARLQLKHYKEVFHLPETEPGVFRLPKQSNVEGLSRALQKSGFFRREANACVRLLDPEIKLELGLPI